ncbi:hypothetical protein [Vibrio nigripulchritudo]|uniref:hypothetical protein n=1 Tax=Vibrio nigripulchritudo TaxID=28173 RepID=UPI002490D9FC|nr:hypothetical protein [Vibrio nigripulchritudo]BDU40909.1 hypothetical protein TUMSATVNIG2_53780 [Vibrio nigripulchritudo]BDU46648.1 hypothetical protein TUMSATVNIG3_54460 [Vibrio nigripulchritudo]
MKKYLALLIVLFSSSSYARTDCPVAKVEHIQVEGTVVLYKQVGFPWRRLGVLNVNNGTEQRLSTILAAQYSGKNVMVAHSKSGFDCNSANFVDTAFIVRTYN